MSILRQRDFFLLKMERKQKKNTYFWQMREEQQQRRYEQLWSIHSAHFSLGVLSFRGPRCAQNSSAKPSKMCVSVRRKRGWACVSRWMSVCVCVVGWSGRLLPTHRTALFCVRSSARGDAPVCVWRASSAHSQLHTVRPGGHTVNTPTTDCCRCCCGWGDALMRFVRE